MTITLQGVIKLVREENLTKEQLEHYYDEASILLSNLQIECADLEKEEALFLADRGENESVIARKISFKVTQAGQRLIVVKRYISATKTMLGSIKNRIYAKL